MLFPPDFLTRLESLLLTAKRVFRGLLLAQRRTMQMGAGLEFSEHREYTAGDDLRYVDWNVYARHGDVLLKRFQEEQDLQVTILVDCSRSMSVGVPSKFDLARQLAAGLACMALGDLDRVAIITWADGIQDSLQTSRGKSHILPVMKFLERQQAAGQKTDLERTVQQWLPMSSNAGLAVVISDFFNEQGFQKGLDLLRGRGLETHVLQVHHPEEASPLFVGEMELTDIETGTVRQVTISERMLRAWRQRFTEHQLAVRDYCRKYAIGCIQFPVTTTFDAVLIQMMRESQFRR